jgi:putative DNA primase/helicase
VYRQLYPDVQIIMAADDDWRTKGNTGLTKATEAAKRVGGYLAVPDFGPDRPEKATDFNDLMAHRGADAVLDAINNARLVTGNDNGATMKDWQDPEELAVTYDANDYPLDALPSGIREAVLEVIEFVQCPAALAANSALAALSVAGQALVDVERAPGLTGPSSLYFLSLADSGERKTSCDTFFTKGIREWEQERQEISPELRERYETWKETRAAKRVELDSAEQSGAPCETLRAELAAMDAAEPALPSARRVMYADFTCESLAKSLNENGHSGAVMSSEGGTVFGGHAMQRDAQMRSLAFFNSMWDGAPYTVDRLTRESFTLFGARLTVGLAVQPDTFRRFFANTGGIARDIGFLARFLVAHPGSTQGSRLFRKMPEWVHLPQYTARLRLLLEEPVETTPSGALKPTLLTMNDAAWDLWCALHDSVEEELRPGCELADIRDVASKAADSAARMAALFHLYANGPSGRIGAASMEAAGDIVIWHLYEARRVIARVAPPERVCMALLLNDYLVVECERTGSNEVERRHVQRNGPKPLRDGQVLEAAIGALVAAHRVQRIERGNATVLAVNPKLLGGLDVAA